MKKVLFIFICLLLIISLGFNVFLGFKYFESNLNNDDEDDSYVVKYNNKSYDYEELMDKYGSNVSDRLIEFLVNDILYDDLSEEEYKAGKKNADEVLDELKDTYDEELEDVVKQYTGYSLDEYINLLNVYNGYQYRVEKDCKKDCDSLIYTNQKEVLDKVNIKFKDDNLEKSWKNKLDSFDELINSNNKNNSDKKDDDNDKVNSDYFIDLTDSGIDTLTGEGLPFILVISRTDCSHCATYKPKLAKILSDYKVYGYYIDVDLADSDIIDSVKNLYEVNATPTTLYINGGKVVDLLVGDLPNADIITFLKNNKII